MVVFLMVISGFKNAIVIETNQNNLPVNPRDDISGYKNAESPGMALIFS